MVQPWTQHTHTHTHTFTFTRTMDGQRILPPLGCVNFHETWAKPPAVTVFCPCMARPPAELEAISKAAMDKGSCRSFQRPALVLRRAASKTVAMPRWCSPNLTPPPKKNNNNNKQRGACPLHSCFSQGSPKNDSFPSVGFPLNQSTNDYLPFFNSIHTHTHAPTTMSTWDILSG